MKDYLDDSNCLTETTLIASADKEDDTFAYRAIETLLKGPEIGLPVGYNFLDPHRKQRQQIRLRWWNTSGKTCRDLAEVREDIKPQIPAYPVQVERDYSHLVDQPPVFFGHYWQTEDNATVDGNIARLDWRVARGGHLAAYRWNGNLSFISGSNSKRTQFAVLSGQKIANTRCGKDEII